MTITHNHVEIEILENYQTPEVQCNEGDIFIKPDEEGNFWVYSWDGVEAWTIGDESFDSLDSAIEAAKEAAENVIYAEYE